MGKGVMCDWHIPFLCVYAFPSPGPQPRSLVLSPLTTTNQQEVKGHLKDICLDLGPQFCMVLVCVCAVCDMPAGTNDKCVVCVKQQLNNQLFCCWFRSSIERCCKFYGNKPFQPHSLNPMTAIGDGDLQSWGFVLVWIHSLSESN